MDQTKKIFDHFICIWKCFYHSLFLSFVLNFFFQCFKLVLLLKNRGQSFSRVVRELFTTWLRVMKLKNAFLAFRQKLS